MNPGKNFFNFPAPQIISFILRFLNLEIGCSFSSAKKILLS